MPAITPARFQKLVLAWFDRFGRKNLPWQKKKSAYRVWVAEIMLQQTQVATVIPYYERFMQRFPKLEELAKAHEDVVLQHWAGLGYYSRARNLHRSAILVWENWGGIFPKSLTELESLPGIGRSTAGAILSCAFNLSAAILDGNVRRVLTRFYGVFGAPDLPATKAKLWELAEQLTPKTRPGDYTQVMMDLGATLCTRSKPRCTDCPLKRYCKAFTLGLTAVLPEKKLKKVKPLKQATFFIFEHQGLVFLQKRPAKGIWGSLWSLPQTADILTNDAIKAYAQSEFELKLKSLKPLPPVRHTFTHYHLDIFPIHIPLKTLPPHLVASDQQLWYSLTKPRTLGLPAPIQTILDNLL